MSETTQASPLLHALRTLSDQGPRQISTPMSETTQAKPRPLIAAKEKGPGPGRYALPSTIGGQGHDATKKAEPSFSFGMSLPNPIFRPTIGPGPAYALNPAVTYKGQEGNPKYTMSPRMKELPSFSNPAPGAYSPERTAPLGEKKAPAYSMGGRTRLRKKDVTPAPNTYSLTSTVGVAPKYSMTGRAKIGGFADDLAKTPGAGTYSVPSPEVVDRKAPSYSMQGRTFMPSDQTKKPGPGAHNPEKVTATQRRAPAYSLAGKHSEYITQLIVDVVD
eukprot:m.80528 g.80528  ORF g.80528 m.80528 type:complete len:275 (-) comp50693_c0_seq1:186-1010(-)